MTILSTAIGLFLSANAIVVSGSDAPSIRGAGGMNTDKENQQATARKNIMEIEDVAISDAIISVDDIAGNATDAGDVEWTPGDEAEPLSQEEIEEIMSHLPSNSVLKDMSAKPGKGLGRNNLKALINSGKPFLLNGLDDDLRAGLEEEAKFRLDSKNQPYLIVIPEKERGNQINFHFVEAAAPHYKLIKEGTALEKKKQFLLSFLEMANDADNDVKANKPALELNDVGNGRKLEGTVPRAKPTRTYQHTAGPYNWNWCPLSLVPTYCPYRMATYWETAYLDYYKTSQGHDIHVTHRGNWNSNYIWDDKNNIRGFANGHSTHELTPPSGYFIKEYAPKNVNNEIQVSKTTGFELSGTAECGQDCSGGVSASYSESETMTYSIKEWEILANGYGKWDFEQAHPFRPWTQSPMYTDFGCYWEGGCLHPLPALSRGNLDYKTAALLTGSKTGWQYVTFKNTGRTFQYRDDGWFSASWTKWTMWVRSGRWVYVG